MSTLIIALPLPARDAVSRYDHVLTPEGQTAVLRAGVEAASLPDARHGVDETVAVVPTQALSWHQVTLPKGIGPGSPRLRAVLQSLLEDRLLDEPSELHLALGPDTAAGGTAWVVVCAKAWLRQHLQSLEAAGRPVTRIVPEFAPHAEAPRLQVLGDPGSAWMALSGQAVAGGVLSLPLASGPLLLALQQDTLPAGIEILSEPAVAALTEQVLQHKTALQQRAQRLVAAAQTPWDLAQFDLASSGRTRAVKHLLGAARTVLRAPQWRPVRWGALLLILAQLAGLNAWAWQAQADWRVRRDAVQGTLRRSFPGVKVVVDAPLQMAREVALLRQAAGAPARGDLEPLLAALGSALAANGVVSGIDFRPGELRLKGLSLGSVETQALDARLRARGYSARAEAGTLVITAGAAP